MATKLTTRDPSRTPHSRALRSTVAYKALMALTGLFLIAFLLMHMFGNTKILIPDGGLEEFDEYAHSLRTFLYPILPPKFFLTLFRIGLGFSALIHILAAANLTFRDYDARTGMGRYLRQQYLAGSFAARTMIWTGIIIVTGVVVHLLQFTMQVVTVGYSGEEVPHMRVILAFQEWWMVLCYAIWVGCVCFHLWHGFYSAFATLGARVGAFSERVLKVCAVVAALLLFIGFMAAPVAILLGVVQP